MTVERNLLMSILKLTKEGCVLAESVNKHAKVTVSVAVELLKRLQKEDIVYIKNGIIEADSCARLKIAVRALALGADLQSVSELLNWQEFEDVATIALERNGYFISKNVRFKHAGKRWEIDVIGCRKPWVLCIDCKRWQRGMFPSALKKIAKAQIERTHAFADSLPNVKLEIECVKWDCAQFVPAILSFIPGSLKFYDRVPIIPILQLQDFISKFPAYTESLKHFWKEFGHLHNDF